MEAKLFPAMHSIAVTPNDGAKILDGANPVRCRGVSFTVAGNLAYKDSEGNDRIAGGLAAGVIHPISTDQILATGTTATGIYAYW